MVQSLLEFPDTCSQCIVLGLKVFSFVHAGERCSLVFMQVIVGNIYALLRTFYQDGLSAALPYDCIWATLPAPHTMTRSDHY